MLALLALACAPPVPEAVARRCGPYADMPDVYGYCVAKLAGGLAEAADCTAAGAWEDRCRAGWVEARLAGATDTETLLAACGEADCRLDVLDHRAEDALLAQVERCGAWAADNAPHCVSHAVQRWRAGHPSAADLAAIASWDGILADWLGHHLAEAVICDGVGSCAGSATLQAACERASAALVAGESACHRPENAPRPMGAPRTINK